MLAAGRLDEAEATFRDAIDVRRRALGGEIGVTAVSIAGLGDVRARRNDFATADSLYRRAVEILGADANPTLRDQRDVYRRMAALYQTHGRPEDAARYRELADGGSVAR
jgi:tetratricopeptide (TPR) repeat protein